MRRRIFYGSLQSFLKVSTYPAYYHIIQSLRSCQIPFPNHASTFQVSWHFRQILNPGPSSCCPPSSRPIAWKPLSLQIRNSSRADMVSQSSGPSNTTLPPTLCAYVFFLLKITLIYQLSVFSFFPPLRFYHFHGLCFAKSHS